MNFLTFISISRFQIKYISQDTFRPYLINELKNSEFWRGIRSRLIISQFLISHVENMQYRR